MPSADVKHGTVHRETHPEAIARRVQEIAPWLLVFEYDYPSPLTLGVLRQTKQEFAGIPLLMLTEQHSESLAVWAFRTGVRDYLVKPIDANMLCGLIQVFAVEPGERDRQPPRENRMPPQPIPVEARCAPNAPVEKATLRAVRHAERHYHEKITLDEAAELCKMSSFQFSRTFKKEHGENFRDFLVRMRIEKAKDLLHNPLASVGDVAHTVGFTDPSQFTRMFRRLVGVSPSNYRLNGSLPLCGGLVSGSPTPSTRR